MNEIKVIGILVCFYPKKNCKAIEEFSDILLKTSTNAKLILIHNASSPLPPHISQKIDDVTFGSNSDWEFSGWDEGVEYIKNNLSIDDNDKLIFANDTFCHHRAFNAYNIFFFNQCISKAKRSYNSG